MIIGIAREIKNNEYRVACHPDGVKELISHGNDVLVEKDAGMGSGYTDQEYIDAGAKIVETAKELYEKSELIYKVKEILPEEYDYMRPGLIVFTYLHSNAHREETDVLLDKKVTGIAYEDITDDYGEFPLLKPMSIIAGKGGFIAGVKLMERINGGQGLLLADVSGVKKPHVTVIGAGNSGIGAAELALGWGCDVSILDIASKRLEETRNNLKGSECLISNQANITMCLKKTDLLINCILWPKWRTDHLIDREMLSLMKRGSIIVDVACDDHGAIETTHSTSHDDPTYCEEGILHYAVDNIPSTFSRTATMTLVNATLPKLIEIGKHGVKGAMERDPHLMRGLTCYDGLLTLEETGLKQNREYVSPEEALGL